MYEQGGVVFSEVSYIDRELVKLFNLSQEIQYGLQDRSLMNRHNFVTARKMTSQIPVSH